MSMRQKCDALHMQVADKVRQLRKKAEDPNVPEVDRQKVRRKLSRYRTLLIEQTEAALNGETKTKKRLKEVL